MKKKKKKEEASGHYNTRKKLLERNIEGIIKTYSLKLQSV